MLGTAVPKEATPKVPRALTVTELARILRDTIQSNPLLSRILVRGEASNVVRTPAGHLFFTLKDATAQVACAIFRDEAESLSFDLEDGMEVVASGDVDLYARRGEVQLVARVLTPIGTGAFWASFQKTRRKLQAEGIFDPSRKRPLPPFPRRVGIVTSEAGAVVHDIVTILRRRYPLASVVVAPARVQGSEAPASLRKALLSLEGRVDVIILARGGGSLEDLWCFNDEALARAVADCPAPVVSAVGHETDVTIVDFAADIRAPTPSAAAELVTPEATELTVRIRSARGDLIDALQDHFREWATALARLSDRLSPLGMRRDLASNRIRTRALGETLTRSGRRELARCREGLRSLGERLEVLGPMATLRRGYAIVMRPDGTVVARAGEVRRNERLIVRLQDGRLHVRVDQKEVS